MLCYISPSIRLEMVLRLESVASAWKALGVSRMLETHARREGLTDDGTMPEMIVGVAAGANLAAHGSALKPERSCASCDH